MTGPGRGVAPRPRTSTWWPLALVLGALLLGVLGPTAPSSTLAAATSSPAYQECAAAPASGDCSLQLTSAVSAPAVALRPVRRDLTARLLPAVTGEQPRFPAEQAAFSHAGYPRPPTPVQQGTPRPLTRRGPPAPAEH